MNTRKKIAILDEGAERERLQKKLSVLQSRRESILAKLGHTRTGINANARQSDRKFRENSARAVGSRTKRADKAMLATVDVSIKFINKKIRQLG